MSTRRRCSVALIALAVAVAPLVGCGGDDGEETASKADQPDTVTVGLIPISGVAPIQLGIKKGFYKEENINVRTRFSAGGAEIVPSVVSGSVDFGYSNTSSLLLAANQRLPLRIITGGVIGAADAEGAWAQIMVAKDSSIRRPADLAGKTIAVNTLKNIAETTAKESLAKNGVDPSGIKLVEIDFPDMPAALKRGQVDAIFEVEPFVTVAKGEGARAVLPPYEETSANLPISNLFTTQRYADEKRDLVQRFVRATQRSFEYGREHPEEAREVLPSYTEIPPKVRQEMQMPTWNPDVDRPGITLLDKLNVKYGLYDKPVDIDGFILK
jgi:NitT/TauT family transport system substrate-binding protein